MGSKAAMSAFPAPFSPNATTMLPFLYQTRTLASLYSRRGGLSIQPRYANLVSRRSFRQSTINYSSDDQTVETSRVPSEPTQQPVGGTDKGTGSPRIRRVLLSYAPPERERVSFSYDSNTSANEPQNDKDGYVLPRTEDTNDNEGGDGEVAGRSVVRRTPSRVKMPAWSTRSTPGKKGHSSGRQSEEFDIPWEEADHAGFKEFTSDGLPEETYQEMDEIDNLTSKSGPRQDRTSTITPSEKHAFQKIFSDIFARSRQSQKFGSASLEDDEEIEQAPGKDQSQRAKAKLDKIVGSAARIQSREEMEIAVNRYPPALRAAAARAIGLDAATQQSHEEVTEVDESVLDNDQLEQLRKPERDRVEGLMNSARTDFELWAVMEKEVFPLITKLGLEERPETDEPTKKRGRKTKRDQESLPREESNPTTSTLDTPDDGISPLAFYGPLYPSYLLLGLRLLDRSFAKPSPLTLSILPRIKSLGVISHVLGASTQLYNELLLIHWYRQDDFRGVLNLLSEMEQFGLDWDKESLEIVDDIVKMQAAVRRGDRGTTLKALWTLPEFAPDKFKSWRNKIRHALDERSRDASQLSY